MNFDWDTIFPLLQSAGLPGLLIGAAVLVFVFIGSFTNILPNGTVKRVAVVILSALFADAQSGSVLSALTAVLAILFSTLGKLAIDYLAALKNKG